MQKLTRVAGGALILASTSPQRKRLLEQMGLDFEVRSIACDEDLEQEENAERLVEAICRQKMDAARTQIEDVLVKQRLLLTSDTLVALDHHRLGKPADTDEAEYFLRLLSGRSHSVLTGVCLSVPATPAAGTGGLKPAADPDIGSSGPVTVYVCSASEVRFKKLSSRDIAWYLETGEWKDAAGGYRIQGAAAALIDDIRGSYTGIVGLPIELVYDIIAPYRES